VRLVTALLAALLLARLLALALLLLAGLLATALLLLAGFLILLVLVLVRHWISPVERPFQPPPPNHVPRNFRFLFSIP